jgi:hypothetical protein
MNDAKARRQPFYLRLENPFPGGSVFSLIEIWEYDTGEWFWRDYMDHCMGPWPTFHAAKRDAEETYAKGWNRPTPAPAAAGDD